MPVGYGSILGDYSTQPERATTLMQSIKAMPFHAGSVVIYCSTALLFAVLFFRGCLIFWNFLWLRRHVTGHRSDSVFPKCIFVKSEKSQDNPRWHGIETAGSGQWRSKPALQHQYCLTVESEYGPPKKYQLSDPKPNHVTNPPANPTRS